MTIKLSKVVGHHIECKFENTKTILLDTHYEDQFHQTNVSSMFYMWTKANSKKMLVVNRMLFVNSIYFSTM